MSVEKDGSNAALIAAWGGLFFLALVPAVYFIEAFFNYNKNALEEKQVLNQPHIEYNDYYADQQERLNSYQMLDMEGTSYQIPIDQAKRLIIQESVKSSNR